MPPTGTRVVGGLGMGHAGTNGQSNPYDVVKRPAVDHPMEAYGLALRALDQAGIPYLVGGGLALGRYGRERDTKDLDIFIRRGDGEPALRALTAAGFTTLDMDVNWLRKALMDDVHIDLILWSGGGIQLTMAEVERGLDVTLQGIPMRIFAPEDMLLRKVYVVREDGPDWEDALSIVQHAGRTLRWEWLDREPLDPRPMAAFLLIADHRFPDTVPRPLLDRLLDRARGPALEPRALAAPATRQTRGAARLRLPRLGSPRG